jgi:hypothetical protein
MTEAEWQSYWDRRESLSEHDWLACPASRPMLVFIQPRASERKVKLFDVACCRRIWSHLDEGNRRAVEAWEQFAEGEIGKEELDDNMTVGWFDPGDHAWSAATRASPDRCQIRYHQVRSLGARPVRFFVRPQEGDGTHLAAGRSCRAVPRGER